MQTFHYKRREPTQTAVHRAVRDNWLTFVAEAESSGHNIPSFIDKAFQKYIGCGVLAGGFVRVRCGDCRSEQLVAFSCKTRGICTSCDGKRMVEAAAHLVDNVVPEVPVRQWVLTVPPWLRYKLAWDHKLAGIVLNIFVRTVSAWYRRQARYWRIPDARCAAISVTQRFGDGLRLSPHFHVAFVDGVFAKFCDEHASFERVGQPRQADVQHLLALTRRKVLRKLVRLGVIVPPEGAAEDELAETDPVLALCSKASMTDRIAVGKDRGKLVARVMAEPPKPRPHGKLCAMLDGFTCHARTRIAPKDRSGLERLFRYFCRPSFSVRRMRELPDGRIELIFKRKWANGQVSKIWSPLDLVAKLVPMVVKPRANLLRYHGQFAANAKWRREVCETPRHIAAARLCVKRPATMPDLSSKLTWAQAMKRCFAIDVLACDCGGRRKVIATIKAGAVVSQILQHLGESTAAPRFKRARPPPQPDFEFYQ